MDALIYDKGKKLYRQAWVYGQAIDRLTRACKNPLDLFQSEPQAKRKKLRDKCFQIALLSTTFSSKSEELLWKKAIYDIIQRCKITKEALDGSSPLFLCYRNHIESCISFYCKLLERLEVLYDLGSNELPSLKDPKFKKREFQWLKDLYYQCFIHLGDLARYQIAIGGDHLAAVSYYHHAIALDSSKGVSYNQLAALIGEKNENLDSVYYYQRSITSDQPFHGTQANLARIYVKNQKKLEALERHLETTTEINIREFTRELLLVRFIHLQQMFHPSEGSASRVTNEKVLGKLCDDILSNLEECLTSDLSSSKETAPLRVKTVLRGADNVASVPDLGGANVCLPFELQLKLCSLAILSSHTLRLLGSTYTPVATTFALSLFSHLLHFSYKHLLTMLHSLLNLGGKSDGDGVELDDFEKTVDNSDSMMDVLVRHKVDLSELYSSAAVTSLDSAQTTSKPPSDVGANFGTPAEENMIKSPKQTETSRQKFAKDVKRKSKKKLPLVINRRRRRKRDDSESSNEESGTCSSDGDDTGSPASDKSLSLLTETLGEDDLELLDSLSSSNSSCDENTAALTKGTSVKEGSPHQSPCGPSKDSSPCADSPSSSKEPKGGKRPIFLAATFNLAPSSSPQAVPATEPQTMTQKEAADLKDVRLSDKNKDGVDNVPCLDSVAGTHDINKLIQETNYQSSLHTVCCLVSDVSSLMLVRVFMEWLQSYPIVVAARSQGSIWSKLATLLNFLPSEEEIKQLGGSQLGGHHVLLEDVALRGLSPLSIFQQCLTYDSVDTLSTLQQVTKRLHFFQKFGHFIADLRTVPSFYWNREYQKFIGPVQKVRLVERRTQEKEKEQEGQALAHRSKLMNAMAQRRLQHVVAGLEETVKEQEMVFTPYLIPDAASLCSGLHIVKKLLASEKFVFVISKSVIETLDNMKKGRDNFTSREVIKFLEKELKSGSKFFRAQTSEETADPKARKPPKMDLDTWYFTRLIDCATHYNQTYGGTGQTRAVVTVLLEKKLLQMVNGSEQTSSEPELMDVFQSAWQCGLEFDSILGFYGMWKSKDNGKRRR